MKVSKTKDAILPASSTYFENGEWIERYGKELLFGILGAFLLLFVWQMTGPRSSSIDKYQAAYVAKERLEKGQVLADGDASRLNETLTANPELLPLYQGLLLQSYLADDQLTKAPASLASSTFSPPGIFPWKDSGLASLYSGEHQYQEALDASRNLHALLLERANKEEAALFAWNFLRIAALEGKLGNQEAEKETWKQIMASIEGKTATDYAQSGFRAIAPFFQEGDFDLGKWIESKAQGS